MKNLKILTPLLLGVGLLLAGTAKPVTGDDGGADLEKAIDLKLSEPSVEQLSKIASLCEQAIKKGLGSEDEKFAKELMTASLYQRAVLLCRPFFGASPLGRDWRRLRDTALQDLEKVVASDKEFGEAHWMISRLQALPGGDRKKAREAASRAIESLEVDDKMSLSDVYLFRSRLQDDPEKQLTDIDRAIELNSENVRAWQMRAFYQLSRGATDKAIADFNQVLDKDSENVPARLAVAETLMNDEQFDEALKHVNHLIERKPTPIIYALRAQLWARQRELEKASADLDEALKLQPGNVDVLMMRARMYYAQDRNALAKRDVETVLAAQPGLTDAIELYSLTLAALGDFDKAISEIKKLLKRDADNALWKLQMAIYLNASGQSRKAISLFSDVLKSEPDNVMAQRGRADAYLNTGDHDKAVVDYESAIRAEPDDTGILNNFAWVLATSPDDTIRDGKRAVKIGKKACELTEYKQAHILSTLAAAFAETGDFESALKWSQEAVDLSDTSMKDVLKKEWESYKKKKPWRERKTEPEGEDGESTSAKK